MDNVYRFSVRDDTSFRIPEGSSHSNDHEFEEFLVLINLEYDEELSGSTIYFNYNHIGPNGIIKSKSISSSGLTMIRILAIDGKAHFVASADSLSDINIAYSNLSENISILSGSGEHPDEVTIEGNGSFTVSITQVEAQI